MKSYARFRCFIADFTRLIETCGGDEPMPLIPNFWRRSADVRAMLQQTA